MRFVPFLVPLLVACSDGADEPGVCAALSEGPWSASGSCFGMVMTTTLTVDGDGCRFTLDDWDMEMSVPEGGAVDGSDVTLSGAGWDDCTGTTDGTSLEGSCGDGCTYEMTYDG